MTAKTSQGKGLAPPLFFMRSQDKQSLLELKSLQVKTAVRNWTTVQPFSAYKENRTEIKDACKENSFSKAVAQQIEYVTNYFATLHSSVCTWQSPVTTHPNPLWVQHIT